MASSLGGGGGDVPPCPPPQSVSVNYHFYDNRVIDDIGLYVEEWVKIYCMLCPKLKKKQLSRLN